LKFSVDIPEVRITATPLPADKWKDYPELERGKEFVELVVADNGIGFDQQYADKIFMIFQRLHSRAEYSGTGIGLALCKKIVENHHGHIRAASEPGHGAVFTIILPL
jgi:signal transduction histidine kinase